MGAISRKRSIDQMKKLRALTKGIDVSDQTKKIDDKWYDGTNGATIKNGLDGYIDSYEDHMKSSKNIKTFEAFSSEYKDIIITIPKNIKWEDYQKELKAAKNGEVLNFKVNHFPKTQKGNKCYIIHDGKVKGYMIISNLSEKEFTCTTTNKKWKGKFIERTGDFHNIDEYDMKGFQGYRYI